MKQGGRISTLGLGGRQQSLAPTDRPHPEAQRAMAGFDQMPQSLRAFLNEYGGYFPKAAVVTFVDTLKAGYGIKITTLDGKVHTIAPDPPSR